MRRHLLVYCIPLLVTARSMEGQFSTAPPEAHPEYATTGAVLSIPAAAFDPMKSDASYDVDGTTLARFPLSGSNYFYAPLNVPSGALLYAVAFEVYDADSGQDMSGSLYRCSGEMAGLACTTISTGSTVGAPGWVYVTPASFSETVDNLDNSYVLAMFLPIDGGATKFRRALAYYQYQVSPAPGQATFADVPFSNPFFQYVEALAASGITGGCGGGNYCPNAPVTRAQMAVFLSKALGLYWPY